MIAKPRKLTTLVLILAISLLPFLVSGCSLNDSDYDFYDEEETLQQLIEMPDIVGLNYEEAQKLLNDKGLNSLYPISDEGETIKKASNWEVISQDVAPGKKISNSKIINIVCKRVAGFEPELIDNLYYKISYNTLFWIQKKNHKEVYVRGTILEINEGTTTRLITLCDSENNKWMLSYNGINDLSNYINTECEAYGTCYGDIEEKYNMPLVFVQNSDSHFTFNDGTTLYPSSLESRNEFPKYAEEPTTQRPIRYVYIPSSGNYYHNNDYCSGMKNPRRVTEEEARSLGYKACGKCR